MKYLVLALSLFLVACGGSGGGVTPPNSGGSDTELTPEVPSAPETKPPGAATFIPGEGIYRIPNSSAFELDELIVAREGEYTVITNYEFSDSEGSFYLGAIWFDASGVAVKISVMGYDGYTPVSSVNDLALLTEFNTNIGVSYDNDLGAITVNDYGSIYSYYRVGGLTDFNPIAYINYNVDFNFYDYVYNVELFNGQLIVNSTDGCAHVSTNYYATWSQVYANEFVSSCGYTAFSYFVGAFMSDIYSGDQYIYYMYE